MSIVRDAWARRITAASTVKVYRGMHVILPEGVDMVTMVRSDERWGLGPHWTTERSVAERFARPSKPYAYPTMTYTTPSGRVVENDWDTNGPRGMGTAILLEGEVAADAHDEPYSNIGVMIPTEHEMTLKPGTPVNLTSLSWFDGSRWNRIPLGVMVTARAPFGGSFLTPDGQWTTVVEHAEVLEDLDVLYMRRTDRERALTRYLARTGDVRVRLGPDEMSVQYVQPLTGAQRRILLDESAAHRYLSVQVDDPRPAHDEALYGSYQSSDEADKMFADAQRAARSITVTAEYDYRGQHQPSSDGPPAHNLLDQSGEWSLPDDIYDRPDIYTGFFEPAFLGETMKVLRRVRGQPNATVTIYRSAPVGLDMINHGDWVSFSMSYARQHGYSNGDDEAGDWPVYAADVAAKDVRHAGDDLMEFGYWGPDTKARVVR